MPRCQSETCLDRWTWAGDLLLSGMASAFRLIPDSTFFVCFSFLSPCYSCICVEGAGGRSYQPPASNGCTDPHRGADNWAAVISWWIPAWREARQPCATLESCQPPGRWETAQVTYSQKPTQCYIRYVLKRLGRQMWILTQKSKIYIAAFWLYDIVFYSKR